MMCQYPRNLNTKQNWKIYYDQLLKLEDDNIIILQEEPQEPYRENVKITRESD